MADSPASSDLSDPPSADSEGEDQLSTAVPSSRPSVDITHADHDHLAPPAKRRKTGPSTLATLDRAPSSQPAEEDDTISISSDNFSDAPGSPSHDEYALREEAQTQCLWKDCEFGDAANNDELVKHVQGTHCATGGPKKTKYVCEWGECQRKTSNHPSGYALKAHMRSHTKEKPYYCALPECDKAFTRSDALAKHMRTVHEPEPARAAHDATPLGSKKSSIKIKLTNGSSTTTTPTTAATTGNNAAKPPAATAPEEAAPAPDRDEDGNPVNPSPANDNISYTPAHHPLTGQPGYMITYPPDVHFTAWESGIDADQLMRLLRRQLHWARKEGEGLKSECAELERLRRQEWDLKEILLEGVLESELARGEREGMLRDVDGRVREAMERDVEPAKGLEWSGGVVPAFRSQRRLVVEERDGDVRMEDADADVDVDVVETPMAEDEEHAQRTPSPPPTGHSGGFDGDADPYDNYLAGRMAEYEERERLKTLHGTPQKQQQREKEAEAVGALMDMSAASTSQ